MHKDITVKKYIEKVQGENDLILELMDNMSITNLPISRIFELSGIMLPEELYKYIMNPENHCLLAQIGFRYYDESQTLKVNSVKRYSIIDSEQLINTRMEDIIYKPALPSKMFYKKRSKY